MMIFRHAWIVSGDEEHVMVIVPCGVLELELFSVLASSCSCTSICCAPVERTSTIVKWLSNRRSF